MPPTSAMFQPLIATTCVSPVAVNASTTSRVTRSRSPIEDPGREAGLGLGERLGDTRVDVPAQALDATEEPALVADESHRAEAHRPRRAPRPQVLGEPRPVVLHGLGATLGFDEVARDDAWEPWQPRVGDAVGWDRPAIGAGPRQAQQRSLL